MKKALVLLFATIQFLSFAQSAADLTGWSVSTDKSNVEVGEELEITFVAEITEGYHMYASDFDGSCGPIPASIIKSTKDIELIEGLNSLKSHHFFDDIFECNVADFKLKAVFTQKVKALKKNAKIELTLAYQVCEDMGSCLSGKKTFTFPEVHVSEKATSLANATSENDNQTNAILTPITETVENKDTSTLTTPEVIAEKPTKNTTQGSCVTTAGIDHITVETLQKSEAKKDSFWSLFVFFGIAFGAGLIALITPCMFPMIPMTVNFFTHSSHSKSESIKKALFYGISIVIIYILVGFTVAVLFNGPQAANLLASHWLPNLIFFAIFILFGLSFLGMFEITLPSSFVNKMDEKSEKGGLIGIFFMALTLVVVSFSCTGPIAGSLLLEAAGGDIIKPIIGMFGFGLSFAIPFTLFAMFPTLLNKLPQSGGWLNSVKVVLGLIEFALALKFLSIADLTSHWGILDRDIFLSLWIAIFIILSMYLLGKIRFPHDSQLDKVGVGRSVLAMASMAFVIYLIPGLWGAPLKGLSGILPPLSTQDYVLNTDKLETTPTCSTPLYSTELEWPLELDGYFDINEAICCAIEQDKPIFVDFTGHSCANCRMMESFVWSEPAIRDMLDEDFVKLALYADDYTIEVDKSKYYTNSKGEKMTSIGDISSDFMVSKFNTYHQPFYAILAVDKEKSTNGKIILKELVPSRKFDLNIKEYQKFLNEGKSEFKSIK